MKVRIDKNPNTVIRNLYCLMALLLPVELIAATSFYSVSTPPAVWYKYRSFDFSFLLIPIIVYAFIRRKRSSAIRFDYLIMAIALKDILFYILEFNNEMIPFDASLYLVLISSWAITVTVLRIEALDTEDKGETFLDWYFLVVIATMFLRIILRMSTDGRYGAIGLSVGGTGFFTAVYFLYLLYVHPYNKRVLSLAVVALISLVLTGQRTNLLFCVLFTIPYVIKNMVSRNAEIGSEKKTLLLWGVFLVGIILVCVVLFLNEVGIEIPGMAFVKRTFDALGKFVKRDINSEASVEGRALSLGAGLKIIKENPYGITNVFYDLQYRMTRLQYPTFPHCGILDCALLWSTPITVFCEIWLIHLLIKLAKLKDGMFWVILYIQVLMIIWGSPFMDYPMLFIILLLLSMAKKKVEDYEKA